MTQHFRDPARVLVVDDSPTVRAFLQSVIDAEPDMIVVSTAESAEEAVELCCKLKPNLVTMDVSLPGSDGIEATAEIMRRCPVPVAIVTATPVGPDTDATFRALAAGAVEVFAKPSRQDFIDHPERQTDFVRQLRLVAGVGVVGLRGSRAIVRALPASPGRSSSVPAPSSSAPPARISAPELASKAALIAIGASTGGPPTILTALRALAPEQAPPVLVTQHMSAEFMPGFAAWLDSSIALKVQIAKAGQPLERGHVYVAPGDRHLRITQQLRIEIGVEAPLHYQRPAVDELFNSVARHVGGASVGVLLTGMGSDGAQGLAALRRAGALTIAQDEGSCVVFGMPKAALDLGAASLTATPETIGRLLACISFRTRSACPPALTPTEPSTRTAS